MEVWWVDHTRLRRVSLKWTNYFMFRYFTARVEMVVNPDICPASARGCIKQGLGDERGCRTHVSRLYQRPIWTQQPYTVNVEWAKPEASTTLTAPGTPPEKTPPGELGGRSGRNRLVGIRDGQVSSVQNSEVKNE